MDKTLRGADNAVMLTRQHIQEGLSRAYALAVACRAGYSCNFTSGFDYGMDGAFHEITTREGRHVESGFQLQFQCKASTNCGLTESTLIHDLEAKNYNDLVATDVGTPRILLVLALPHEDVQWLDLSVDALILRRCMWWHSLRGQEPTSNERTARIHIPRDQQLTVEGLRALMQRVRAGTL
jgi:hypothetical protein